MGRNRLTQKKEAKVQEEWKKVSVGRIDAFQRILDKKACRALDYREIVAFAWQSTQRQKNRKWGAREVDLKMETGFILEKSTKGKQMNHNKTGLRGDPGSYRRGPKNWRQGWQFTSFRGILSAHKEKLNQTLWEGPGNMISSQLVACGICITHG